MYCSLVDSIKFNSFNLVRIACHQLGRRGGLTSVCILIAGRAFVERKVELTRRRTEQPEQHKTIQI